MREARLLAQLAHRNVVAIYDVGVVGEQLFLAMELVVGGTLSDWRRAAPRSWRDIVARFVEAARGLAAAHAAGIVHRDFKPANVLVGSDGRARITDFGLSRGTDDAGLLPSPSPTDNVTESGVLVGTPAYMAPEQRRGITTAASDQYSFCVALTEALDGQLPVEQGLPLQSQWPPVGAPRAVRRVIERGLRQNPGERFASMDALIVELARDPGERRRRTLVAVGGLALLVANVLLVARTLGGSCAGGESLFDRVLSAVRRQKLTATRDRMVASNVALADEEKSRWQRYMSDLDRYHQAWSASYTEACEATRRRHTQTEDAMELRMACLDSRLASVDAFVSQLELGDRDRELQLASHERLDPLWACSDLAELSRPIHLPADAATRAKIAAVRARIARAQAANSAGDVRSAHSEAHGAVDDARATGYGPVLAEALFSLGAVEKGASEGLLAQPDLESAALTGESAHHDYVVAQARVELVDVVGGLLDHVDEAQHLVPRAQAALERWGDDPPLRRALLVARARVATAAAKPDDARAFLQEDLRALGSPPPNDSQGQLELARLDESLGAVELGAQNRDQARADFERALAIEVPLLGRHHPEVLKLRFDINDTRPLQGHLADWQDILRLTEELYGPNHLEVGRVLGRIGLTTMDNKPLIASVGLPAMARAMAIYQVALPADHHVLLATRAEYGALLMQIDRYAEAEPYLAERLAYVQKHPRPRKLELTIALSMHTVCLLKMQRYPEAKAEIEQQMSMWSSHTPLHLRADTQYSYAQVLWVLGNKATARSFARQAVAGLRADSGAETSSTIAIIEAWLKAH